MQPYFFPYIGYFQLIEVSDIFVIHDDVQYVKQGWVNRNRILRDDKVQWISFPVLKSSHDNPINERFYKADPETRNQLLRRIEAAYREASQFGDIYSLIANIMRFPNRNVATFNTNLIAKISTCIGINTTLIASSKLPKDERLSGQDRVIDICRYLGATSYINPIGGRKLYQAERFSREGMALAFLEPAVLMKTGLNPPLSIIDHLMHRSGESLSDALDEYRLIPG